MMFSAYKVMQNGIGELTEILYCTSCSIPGVQLYYVAFTVMLGFSGIEACV